MRSRDRTNGPAQPPTDPGQRGSRRGVASRMSLLVALVITVGACRIDSPSDQATWDGRSDFASARLNGTTATSDGAVALTGRPRSTVTRPTATMGPLRRLRSNPRYFTADGTTAVYLTGSHTWENLVDGSTTDPPAAFDYRAYLANLKRWHHNFIRLWAWDVSFDALRADLRFYSPQPFLRSGPGSALDGKPKFDLSRFNQAYFDRLRSRVVQARSARIYVSIMLFEGYTPTKGPVPAAYQGHPFAVENNINGIDGDVNDDGRLTEVYALPGQRGLQAINEIQKAYVRKVIDSVNDLDNVLYEIANEAPDVTTEWQYELIDYIKSHEARKPEQHPVGMTFQSDDGENATLLESRADWVSPRNEIDDPPATSGSKVIVSDSDHHCGICEEANGDWVWREFTSGRNPIFMDAYEDQRGGLPNASGDSARKAMGETRQVAGRVNLAAMKPDGKLASTGYVLADPGREYLVYQPESKPFTLELPRESGKTFTVRWIAVGSSSTTTETISVGRDVTLETPFDAAAAYVRANDAYRAVGSVTLNHDAGEPKRWTKLTIEATTSPRTGISVEMRTSNDSKQWSTWQRAVTAVPKGRFVQIRVRLSTADTRRTPMLDKVTLQ